MSYLRVNGQVYRSVPDDDGENRVSIVAPNDEDYDDAMTWSRSLTADLFELTTDDVVDIFCDNYTRRRYAFCDNYAVHERHVYTALNGDTYECTGLSEGDLCEILNDDPGTCEHGLSADLCSGPSHYPLDF